MEENIDVFKEIRGTLGYFLKLTFYFLLTFGILILMCYAMLKFGKYDGLS